MSCSTVDCAFPLATMTFTGGNPAKLMAVKQAVKPQGLLCPGEVAFDTEYEITSPKPVFVE